MAHATQPQRMRPAHHMSRAVELLRMAAAAHRAGQPGHASVCEARAEYHMAEARDKASLDRVNTFLEWAGIQTRLKRVRAEQVHRLLMDRLTAPEPLVA